MIYQDSCALPQRAYPSNGIPLYALPGMVVVSGNGNGGGGGGWSIIGHDYVLRKRDHDNRISREDEEILLIIMNAVNVGVIN